MKLINRKQLSLDHTLEQYYPVLYGTEKGKITIRNLLTHSSGLKGYKEFYKIDSNISRDKMITSILELDLELEFS